MFLQANSPPMTAAERQRKCRAGGKGKHRGPRRPRARLRVQRARDGADLLAREAAAIATAARYVRWTINAMAA